MTYSPELQSNLLPGNDGYDVGLPAQKWQDGYFANALSATTLDSTTALSLGVNTATAIDIGSATVTTTVANQLNVTHSDGVTIELGQNSTYSENSVNLINNTDDPSFISLSATSTASKLDGFYAEKTVGANYGLVELDIGADYSQLLLQAPGGNHAAFLANANEVYVSTSQNGPLRVDALNDILNLGTSTATLVSIAQNGVATNVGGLLNVAGNTLPAIDDGYSLGSPSLRWKDGYFANNSLHIVSTEGETGVATDWNISVIQDGYLSFNNVNDGYLTITNFGNIGIGITNPAYNLETDGYVKALGYKFTDGTTMTTAPTGGGGVSIGDTVTGATAGSILFAGTSSILAQDNTNFFWDNSNKRLGVGTNAPTEEIDLTRDQNAATRIQIRNATSNTAAEAGLALLESGAGSQYGIVSYRSSGFTTAGLMVPSQLVIQSATSASGGLLLSATHASAPVIFTVGGIATTNERLRLGITESVFNDSGSNIDFRIEGDTNANLLFADASTDRIGIGTNTPAVKLDVTTTAATETVATFQNTSLSDGALNVTVTGNNSIATNSQNRGQLHISGGHPTTGSTDTSDGSANLYFTVRNSTLSPTERWFKFAHRPYASADSLNLYSSSVETLGGIMTWTRAGNVGIHVIAPQSLLHVQTAAATDTVATFDSSSISDGATSILVSGKASTSTNQNTRGLITIRGGHPLIGSIDDSGATAALTFDAQNSTLSPTQKWFKFALRPHASADSLNLFSDTVITTGGVMTWTRAGNVAIGSIVPTAKFHVSTSTAPAATQIAAQDMSVFTADAVKNIAFRNATSADPSHAMILAASRARGTMASPLTVANGDKIFRILAQGYEGTARQSAAAIDFDVDGTVAAGTVPISIAILTAPDTFSNAVERVRFGSGASGKTETVFNESGANYDLRIEGDTDANLIFADASVDRVGIGTSTPGSKLQTNGSFAVPIVTKLIDYTATVSDHTILCDATSGVVTITLPAVAGTSGRLYVIKKIDSSANNVVVDGNGSEVIDGATTQTLTSIYESITIQSNGSAWYII